MAADDAAEKLYVSAAASLSRHPRVANYLTVELAALKELSRELADLFGLTLPLLFERQARKTFGYQFTADPNTAQ